ncbi:hypothetical protein LN042_32495 [Kitasatospora sp. RB6PN24]|uniref:hypothetical protein n=1 Tax=Kitasatospora humi TaxID=2893891 RepID=UPI001E52E470|nr:hypothetical protein [Kitasatospora humi]MCC9311733.1 hypothetical protein [Kitasatospora humi]
MALVQDDYERGDGSTYRAPQACPLCAGELRPVQVLSANQVGGLMVKVHVVGRMFARKTYVEALACRGCGHLLSFMSNPEIMDEPPAKIRWSRGQ